MHMSDALVSPSVGGAFWAVSAIAITVSSRAIKSEFNDSRGFHEKGGPMASAPPPALMGTAGAFVFAAQMINFAIPGAGSSGHLGGGLLLTALLGPHAALLTMASILAIQAFFFGDGGLLALGCNIFNLGFIPAFVAWPLVFRAISSGNPSRNRILPASMASGVFALFLGASMVILQTTLSGISALSIPVFALLMIPIHLAIGLVEGLVTAGILGHLARGGSPAAVAPPQLSIAAVPRLATAAFLTAGILSWFAASDPDGLEWSVERAGRSVETSYSDSIPEHESGMKTGLSLHAKLKSIQEKTTIFPDYDFRSSAELSTGSWPSPNPGTTAAGLTGTAMTLAAALLLGTLAGRLGKRIAIASEKQAINAQGQ